MKPKTPDELVKLLNQLAYIDIEIVKVTSYFYCTESELPSDFKTVVKFLDEPSRKLILSLNKGKPKISKGVKDFDLTAHLKYFDEDYPDLADSLEWIKTYFQNREVQVMQGKGSDKGEYPFNFDWFLVPDLECKTLFCFILNLQD